MKHPASHYQDLFELIASVQDPVEAKQLLEDLLTPQEMDAVCERWQLVQQLIEGKPQRQISEDLGVSIGTITRGSRMIQYGSGGFQVFYDRLKQEHVK